MSRFMRRNALWGVYLVFLAIALAYGGRESLFDFSMPFGIAKAVILLTYFAFLAYSIQAHRKENFLRTVKSINKTWWGLQIGLDLYISVFLSLALIYLVEGSIAVTLLWAIPVIIFANLAILPYLILNYEAVVRAFIG